MIYTNEMIKKKKENKQKRGKILRVLFIPLVLIIIILVIDIVYQKYIQKSSSISILGYKVYTVLTGSMEPKYNIGDVIIEKTIEEKDIKVGTVVTYKIKKNKTITHRVVEIVEEEGKTLYRLKGDNNNSPDKDLVNFNQIQGTILFKIDKIGIIIAKFSSGIGMVIIVVLIGMSYAHSSRSEEKRIAREDARKRFNVPKYKKEKML